jgi:hypothetical protein
MSHNMQVPFRQVSSTINQRIHTLARVPDGRKKAIAGMYDEAISAKTSHLQNIKMRGVHDFKACSVSDSNGIKSGWAALKRLGNVPRFLLAADCKWRRPNARQTSSKRAALAKMAVCLACRFRHRSRRLAPFQVRVSAQGVPSQSKARRPTRGPSCR